MGKIQPALCVGNDARTMKRWAAALSSDDLEFALRAFGGRGADGKVKPPLARYVQRRYRQLAGTVRCYRRLIAAEVEDLFAERLSGETLRRLFREADREDAEPEAGSRKPLRSPA